MEFPGDVRLVLDRLRDGLTGRRDLVGIYVYGSLVTGDFSPAGSDIASESGAPRSPLSTGPARCS